MSNLEITRLCALAMGYSWEEGHEPVNCFTTAGCGIHFDPLHDDAQAMALVKRFRIEIVNNNDEWWVGKNMFGIAKYSFPEKSTLNLSLNRAICEFVAMYAPSPNIPAPTG